MPVIDDANDPLGRKVDALVGEIDRLNARMSPERLCVVFTQYLDEIVTEAFVRELLHDERLNDPAWQAAYLRDWIAQELAARVDLARA